ncbi:TRAP transporter large permease subunit [Thiofaba sp. EF100]|uniref:TRAP transporter large permease n=1 Tax=Thiofaba sp. EF100 TaxID=3121274 RepID=UPI0032220E39
MDALWPLLLFLAVFAGLMVGYPVAFTLAGVSLTLALLGSAFGAFDLSLLEALPNRIFGAMSSDTLVAVPLFILMGVILEKARIAEDLLGSLAGLAGQRPGALAFAVLLVGALLAASTGIVGATVVTMGLLALPAMLQRGYDARLACGTICAAGTLGQIIPPSIILVLLGDQLSSAYSQAQLAQGIYAPKTVSVGDLFAGALIPGLLLVVLYALYLAWLAWRSPARMPAAPASEPRASIGPLLQSLWPPMLLILAVLGAILGGIATPSEAAAVGAAGALLLAALRGQLNRAMLADAARASTRMTSMVFLILIGASLFSLVFRGFGGDDVVHEWLGSLPGGVIGAMLVVMLVMFLLGFMLDFIEIIFVVVPIVAPILLMMGLDPIWLGIMIAINLQTSFLTPPFGFALFYLRGAAPDAITTLDIYRGVVPFIALQVVMLIILAIFPGLATALPAWVYGH